MKEIEKIVEKLKSCEKIMAEEKGPFDLFGLFLRDDAPDKWDLVIAGEWIEKDADESFFYVIDMLTRGLPKEDMLKLSRVVVLKKKNPDLEAMYRAIGGGRNIRIKDSIFFGLQIKEAYIITLRRRGSK